MGLTRIFHPVGQGAFYTEKHQVKDNEFNIVYDCGSLTIKGRKMEKKIQGAYSKGGTIDILFISHLHSDHINGIEYLKKHFKISKVVMPLINEETKTLLKLNNFLRDNNINTQIIDAPELYFGDSTEVLLVEETDFDSTSPERSTNNNPEGPKQVVANNYNGGKASPIPSGSMIYANMKQYEWGFIPYNYKQKERIEKFLECLADEELTLGDIDTIEKISAHLSKLKRVYKEIDGDLNQNSMILFSGKAETQTICSHQNSIHYSHPFIFHSTQSGCLYLGDIDLKVPNIVTDIKSRLRQYLPFIGTIQIPHHGAIGNFDSSILESKMEIAIASFGTTNSYGHPSDKVLSEIIVHDILPLLVTQEQGSMVTQWTVN